MKRLLVALSTIALLLPANAFARAPFDPTHEFEQNDWIPIHLGPLNLSITKAVVYLMLASVAT
jgi:F-type H+-transporting ATPase subunit a